MSKERPRGHYTGPLDNLRWSSATKTVRADPMNYLAADLSRIDASLWGREDELGRLIAEAPAMLEALRNLVEVGNNGPDGVCHYCGRDNAGHEREHCSDDCVFEQARFILILARIDGEAYV